VAQLEIVAAEPMGGYADRAEGVQGVLDPLEVHAVTFADDDHRFVLIVADLVCVNVDIVERIRAAVRPLNVDSCWVAATHTHASPEAGCFPGGSTTPPDVGIRLITTALDATKAALANEQESALRPTRVHISDFAGRRNDADAGVDVPVDALVVTNDDGIVGAIVVCPVHPTVLPADNSHVSADLNGGIRRALGAGNRWVVVATGAAGNMSTRHTRRGRKPSEIDRLGGMVADELEINEWVPTPSNRNGLRPPAEGVIELEPKKPEEIDHAIQFDLDNHGSDERSRQAHEEGRRVVADLAAQRRTEPYRFAIQAMGLGSVTLVGIPAELFLELGESIRANASTVDGTSVIVLGYTNGYLGYLTNRDTPPTYETLVSPVRRGSGEQVAEAAIKLVQTVAEARSTT
jgi:hypothetical protein